MHNTIIIYKDGESELPVEVTPYKETVWLRAEEMADLFERDRSVIQRHIKNIFKENELDQTSTCAKFAQVKNEGNNNLLFKDENKIISDSTLVAITLLLAESKPEEKEIMISIIMNFLEW